MRIIGIVSLLITVASANCYSSDADEFLGRWELDIIEERSASGEWSEFDNPQIGINPIGYIQYDANGYMSVQMMRRNKLEKSPNYIAYYATYEVLEDENVVLHHIIGNLLGEPGVTARRAYILEGNTLILMPNENRRLRWVKR